MNKGALSGLTMDDIIPAGVIWEYAGGEAPDGWLICDGSVVSRAQYPRLFKAIGVRHGAGNGTTTFNVPNRKGRVGVGYDATDGDFNAIGKTGGLKTSTAPHDHSMNNHTHTVNDHQHTIAHVHATNPHDHHLNGHGHTVNSHGHGGGTGVHAHNNANGTVFSTNNATHAHNGGAGQASESPGTGAATGWGTNLVTNSVGQGNWNESPGTDGNWGLTSGVWNSTANQGSGSSHSGWAGSGTGGANGATGGSSAGATNGNLQPFIAMQYIIKA